MLTHEGYVAECTGDNIFIVKDSELVTPPVEVGALEGITRDAVIGIAKKTGIRFTEKLLKMEDVYAADEVFLTGTAAEVIPVVKIDGRGIGEGSPGKITNMLLKNFQALTHKDGVRYTL